jgi:two-component system NarL family response regulator
MGDKQIRVLCVDDHRVVREGIEAAIARENDMTVVASAVHGIEAVDLFRRHRPDVTLMDLQLPLMSGLDAIIGIRREDESAKIIVLTMYQGDEDIYRCLQAGAATYLFKDAIVYDLARVIRDVHNGARPLSQEVERILASRAGHPPLTSREVEVLELIAQGCRNKEIAAALRISEATAKVHVKKILAKLNVNDRTAAITVGIRRGIIHVH